MLLRRDRADRIISNQTQTSSLTSHQPTPTLEQPQMTTPSGKLIGPRQRKIALLGSRSVGQSQSSSITSTPSTPDYIPTTAWLKW